MVPCQPQKLVILSLPFAALVAFFWYKRRKNLSRSDPGGTLAQTKTVDKTAKLNVPNNITEFECAVLDREKFGERTTAGCDVKNTDICKQTEIEEFVLRKVENIVSSSPKFKNEVTKLAFNSIESEELTDAIDTIEKEDIICIEPAVDIAVESKFLCTGVENYPATPEFDNSTIFHSTKIEDENYITSEDDQHLVEEFVLSCNVVGVESVNICSEKEDEDKEIEGKADSIFTEEQSTVKVNLEDQIISGNTSQTSIFSEKSLATLPVEDTVVQSDFNIKGVSSTSSDIVGLEDISTDTGLGSQDLSAIEDSNSDTIVQDSNRVERLEDVLKNSFLGSQNPSVGEDSNPDMAQGQKTEENTQNNAAGLEQKLASLGLDTQQPAQRAERDSANHSPAEVMLSSPAISTFSDAHSEGSSDSGKGCSDVVTPPSRTPAGGSSVAGDQVPSIYEFVLPQVIVGRLIGRHGAFLHDIRAKTHTNVFIKRHPETSTLKICAIEGTQQDIDAALKMIRQKFPLRRFPELTLERVTFVKNSCLPINPENLQLHLVEGVNNDVIISSLITAGHFFLQLPMHMSYQSLYRLACIMNSVYNTQESPPLPDPQPDVVCVAPAHGGWYRAQILSIDEEANTSDIRFLDYGGFITVDNSLLRQIRGDFLLLPFQAVECALANVVPAGGEEEWSEEAKQFVQLMTIQQTLQAQVFEYTDAGLPMVYLYCTQFYQSLTDPNSYETKVVLLNQELVSRGFAELIDPSQEGGQITGTESS